MQNTNMNTHAEKTKKSIPSLNSSAQSINNSGSANRVGRTAKHLWSSAISKGRKKATSIRGSNSRLNLLDRNDQTKRAVRVLNEDGHDVTPLSLYEAEPGELQPKTSAHFLDEVFSSSGSDRFKSTSSLSVCSSSSFMGSSRPSSRSYKGSPILEAEDARPAVDTPPTHTVSCELPVETDNVTQHLSEEMLDEVVNICLTETDTISLLDIPPTFISEDADDAETVKKENSLYAELCKNRMGNDKYVMRSMQTFNGAPKDKEIQCDQAVMVDKGTTATVWDIYDSSSAKNETSENDNYPESTLITGKSREKSGESSSNSSTSTVGTGSTNSSVLDVGGNTSCEVSNTQQIMLSESFQHSLSIMMRNIMAKVFQPRLALYRQLPILEDPDSTVAPEPEEDETSCVTPALQCLWAFSCELTRGCNITSMAWNKKNPDLLAVGYRDCEPRIQKPGMICCWSLKDPLWPGRVFHCHSSVTSLDFSANNPSQLAVGMFDGTVALYDVQCQDARACIASSSECSNKHLLPVWQVTWSKQEMKLSGEENVEALISVSADGRITKWLISRNRLDCIDVMVLGCVQNTKEATKKKKKSTVNVLSTAKPALWVDFHPVAVCFCSYLCALALQDSSIYLAGTWDGLIYKCSISNRQHFLATYQTHFRPVNHVEWSPFSPDMFLSCSSDWTIQLWRQGHFSPLLSFTSTHTAVHTVRWSPLCSTVFAAINEQQLEIWDLNLSTMHPTIVHHPAPGVKMTALLFATGTNCILVGDSDGQVTVYHLKNLRVDEGKQVDSLEEIIKSAVFK